MRIKFPGSKRTYHLRSALVETDVPGRTTRVRYRSWMIQTDYDLGDTFTSSSFGLVFSQAQPVPVEDAAVNEVDSNADDGKDDQQQVAEDNPVVDEGASSEDTASTEDSPSTEDDASTEDDEPSNAKVNFVFHEAGSPSKTPSPLATNAEECFSNMFDD